MKVLIRVVPNSKREEVHEEGTERGMRRMRVKVGVPAKEGKANARCVELLAEHFNVPKSSVTIVKGLHSKDKVFTIDI